MITELDKLSAPHEAVLLCYERPPFHASNWCHRTMLSDWIRRETGLVVEEIVDS